MADTAVQTDPGLGSSAQDTSQHDPGAASAQAGSATMSGKPLTPAAPQPERPTPSVWYPPTGVEVVLKERSGHDVVVLTMVSRIGDEDEEDNEDEDDEEDDDEFIPRGQSAHAASGGKPKGGRPR
ncbi:hypothetical protein ONZ51_g7487 [Trametes cubensis]|uniref:Uncharacterized protein n=1 Tax=Trametes cubensis TaxID=1111947 RepID=A0AAD7TSI7_9APHY|nr:hypothetical protein ONZ51_g7487 [Trametes cubensis]